MLPPTIDYWQWPQQDNNRSEFVIIDKWWCSENALHLCDTTAQRTKKQNTFTTAHISLDGFIQPIARPNSGATCCLFPCPMTVTFTPQWRSVVGKINNDSFYDSNRSARQFGRSIPAAQTHTTVRHSIFAQPKKGTVWGVCVLAGLKSVNFYC